MFMESQAECWKCSSILLCGRGSSRCRLETRLGAHVACKSARTRAAVLVALAAHDHIIEGNAVDWRVAEALACQVLFRGIDGQVAYGDIANYRGGRDISGI